MAGFLQLLEKTWQPGGIPLSPAALSLEIEALLCPSVWEVAVSGYAPAVWEWALRRSVLTSLWGGSQCPDLLLPSQRLGDQSGSKMSHRPPCPLTPLCPFSSPRSPGH